MREAKIERVTTETHICVGLGLDGCGEHAIATGVGFFDHMLEQLARHGGLDLSVRAEGDRHIDDHHTVEDVGIALGQAIAAALGDKRGIVRYGHAYVPMDETLTRAVVDLSGRPHLVFDAPFHTAKIGSFDTQLVAEFFRAFAMNSAMTLHVAALYGTNDHHIAESCFKSVARALKVAASIDAGARDRVPSTKGTLTG